MIIPMGLQKVIVVVLTVKEGLHAGDLDLHLDLVA